MKNIAYQTDAIARYFATNRVSWAQFYPSERALISRLALDGGQRVLDVGCGCGGLGLALRERFGVRDYTGVEINAQAAYAARQLNPDARVIDGDILDASQRELQQEYFDVVFSLSCVDWNVRFADMLDAAWAHVRRGGHLVATFRLTLEEGCSDPERSYQFINFEGVKSGERAAYVVLNAAQLGRYLAEVAPARVLADGYWGTPSATAVTPYERLCFVAIAIRKRDEDDTAATAYLLDLPAEVGAPLQAQAS